MTEQYCPCVTNHNPNTKRLHKHHIIPKAWGGTDAEPMVYEHEDGVVDNLISICPTSHNNLHKLLNEYVKLRAEPPWSSVRQYYSAMERWMAKTAWDWWIETNGVDIKPPYSSTYGVDTIDLD